MTKQFFGKYRGKVASTKDDLKLGRVQVEVPEVLGEGRTNWAMPCTPYAGAGVGMYFIPAAGANVWVEFEGGNPDYPIWVGCYWADKELPKEATSADVKLIKTTNLTIVLNDKEGLTVEVKSPAASSTLKITMNKAGIELHNQNAVIKMSAASINLNNGALEVS